ncbi:hypothetical protein IE53DRAFT_385806 [Violaceomyces palustris]|uniref:Uncharacterized protein n=1 Tax=Violaceomyces palustris TaxID=1673888 RepID=A0ACD0P189_9BASI|nr:hypothetical protein IE53DRAFT_385806 [Violaceomyces palustris]
MFKVSPNFTPIHSLVGGLMMASSVHHLLSNLGQVLGISGFFHSTVQQLLSGPPGVDRPRTKGDITSLRTARFFTCGLLFGGILLGVFKRSIENGLKVAILDKNIPIAGDLGSSLLMGLLVGAGTKIGSGCTSGHFLCGISRFSVRSLVATATFFSVAVITHVNFSPPLLWSDWIHPKHLSPKSFVQPNWGVIGLFQLPVLFYGLAVRLMAAKKPSGASSTSTEVMKRHEFASDMTAFTVGLHFALGLATSGMLRPSKVLGFLNLSPNGLRTGAWDPSLAMVAVGGIIPTSIGYFYQVLPRVNKLEQCKKERVEAPLRARPTLYEASPEWRLPSRKDVDLKLVGGAALFGIGWGATGLCPGPALVSLTAGFPAILSGQGFELDSLLSLSTFVGSMALGGILASMLP